GTHNGFQGNHAGSRSCVNIFHRTEHPQIPTKMRSSARDSTLDWSVRERGKEGHWFWRWKFKIAVREVRLIRTSTAGLGDGKPRQRFPPDAKVSSSDDSQ